jgi:hypothetical protein
MDTRARKSNKATRNKASGMVPIPSAVRANPDNRAANRAANPDNRGDSRASRPNSPGDNRDPSCGTRRKGNNSLPGKGRRMMSRHPDAQGRRRYTRRDRRYTRRHRVPVRRRLRHVTRRLRVRPRRRPRGFARKKA